MSGVNKATLIGHLGDDPKCGNTQGGTAYARLRLATTKRWKDRQTGEKREATEWHRVVVWGGKAEFASQYLRKGNMVYVEGELQTSSYQKDGQTHFSTEIVVTVGGQLQSLERPSGDRQPAEKPQPQNKPVQRNDDLPFDDRLDDIPF